MTAAALLVGVSPAGAATVVSEPFTGSGSWSVPAGVETIDILVVGGGGGGGGNAASSGGAQATGGGGGGGEVKVCAGVPVAGGGQLDVTVGAGGTAFNPSVLQRGTTGGTSSASYASSTVCSASGGEGGNGGQGSPPYYQGGTSGDGDAGGTSNNANAGGGGGGAGGVGADVTFPGGIAVAGDGGNGIAPGSLLSPGLFADLTATFYGGGGGGGRVDTTVAYAGSGGTGGGGPGRPRAPGPAGLANTGGGGGGNGDVTSDLGAGDGGSGYVVVRYLVVRPANTTQPVVSGSSIIGGTVSTTDGAWTGGPTSYSYKWQRCDDDQGAGCTDISGATASSYTSVSADGGKYLRSQVTATNVDGDALASSSNYLRIAPAPAPTPSNSFTIASSKGSGSSLVTRVRVPGPGEIGQVGRRRGGSGAAARGLVCTDSRTVARAGTYKLTCRANASTRRAQRDGKVRVVLRTTFTPTAGTSRSSSRIVTLPSLKPRYTG